MRTPVYAFGLASMWAILTTGSLWFALLALWPCLLDIYKP